MDPKPDDSLYIKAEDADKMMLPSSPMIKTEEQEEAMSDASSELTDLEGVPTPEWPSSPLFLAGQYPSEDPSFNPHNKAEMARALEGTDPHFIEQRRAALFAAHRERTNPTPPRPIYDPPTPEPSPPLDSDVPPQRWLRSTDPRVLANTNNKTYINEPTHYSRIPGRSSGVRSPVIAPGALSYPGFEAVEQVTELSYPPKWNGGMSPDESELQSRKMEMLRAVKAERGVRGDAALAERDDVTARGRAAVKRSLVYSGLNVPLAWEIEEQDAQMQD